jgi:uncharacterized membrane protein YfcA
MTLIALVFVSAIAWFISTLAGGGSPMILIPVVSIWLGSQAVAPVVTLGMFLGNTQRAWLFWDRIDWRLTAWFAPGAIAGAILGAYAFTKIDVAWLEMAIGLFLILSVLGSNWMTPEKSNWRPPVWSFLPLGVVKAVISGLVGSSGQILNPFYLNYGLSKENLIATKSVNVLIIHTVKIITYVSLGVIKPEYLGYGLILSLAAIPGNLLGQQILQRMSGQQFRQVVLAMMLVSGVLMICQNGEIQVVGSWLLGLGHRV